MSSREVDITPDPKILSVLGEIEFKPAQCIAELIDNAVDGFLRMVHSGNPIDNPTAHVAFGRDTVTVKDNGPGMSLEELQNAVRAGWSSNEKFGSLGLYGVGFNIATARLGSVTTIWTTQSGDDSWIGLEINLVELARGGTFKLEAKSRMKSDPSLSGTEVEVTKIRPDWKDLIINNSWIRSNITDRLSRIYGTMLRDLNPQPIKFSLYINNKKVSAWGHCTWPEDWERFRKSEGLVRPVQEIDLTFGVKYISRTTGQVYEKKEGLDENDLNDLLEVPERVYGWIGIQRYADAKEFGIDILRNGRKIEVGCKDIFDWEVSDDETIREYPIDDLRQKGRIVGEIHLDHGYVHYTKHRFEREHFSWKQLLLAVRDNEPLTNRERYNFSGVNVSPLGKLFRTFRRNSPLNGQSYNDILFIKDNEKAKDWAKEYRKGNNEYKDSQRWQKELLLSDGAQQQTKQTPTNEEDKDDFILGPSKKNTGTTFGQPQSNGTLTDTSNQTSETPVPGMGQVPETPVPGMGQVPETPVPGMGQVPETFNDNGVLAPGDNNVTDSSNGKTQPKQRKIMRDLCFHITGVGISGRSYDVEVYTVDSYYGSQSEKPLTARLTEKNIYEININLQHPAFNSTSLQVRDAVLAQVAYMITFEENAISNSSTEINYSDILIALRNQYATTNSLDTNQLRVEIDTLRRKLTTSLSQALSEQEQKELLNDLTREDAQRIELAQARGPRYASLVSYLEMKHLAQLVKEHPEMFIERAKCFNQTWNPAALAYNRVLLDEYRDKILRELSTPMIEIGEFMSDLTPATEQTRSYLFLIRACVNRLKDFLVDG